MLEREMTKKEKAKEKRLKDKYDDSDMKKSMKKQYGDDWKNVYYATIRKKAMSEDTLNKKFNSVIQTALERMETETKSLASLRNRSSFDAQNRLKDKNKLPSPKIAKPAQLDLFKDSVQNEGEAGDHDRMYKVVHVKKGVMDIKAKTSYEAAKKFAKEKGLKSTAGVDTHLYPLEEGAMSDLHARIMSSDDPHEEIYKMLTTDGPEAEYIQDMYNETSIDRGLHPDDDFEDIIDAMVAELDDDMPFEDVYGMKNFKSNMPVVRPNKDSKFKSNMPIAKPNKNRRFNPAPMPGMPGFGTDADKGSKQLPWWMREGYYKMPDIDRERYTEMPGLEGPFQTKSGKPIYYDPKEGSYYDRDTDMYLTYAEFKALDDPMPSTGRMKEDEGVEDDEFDPRRVKANVMKHLVDMYNDAKKDDGYSSEKMDFALGNLLHDMDMAGYMNSDYYDIEGFFHKGIDKKQDYKVNMGMLKKAYAQAKNLPDDTTVDPEIFTRGGSAMKHVATEGNSPHKKGTKKYKAHMAAMHANSVDLGAMRNSLKLDESTDANTVIAEYTRATLDHRHNTWGKVCEQINHVRSFVKEDIDIKNVQQQILKMHQQENIDNVIIVSENIDKLRKIVADKSAMPIKFADGSMKVDMTTANIFLQVFDKVKEETQAKIVDRIQTKSGFLSVLDKMYSMIG